MSADDVTFTWRPEVPFAMTHYTVYDERTDRTIESGRYQKRTVRSKRRVRALQRRGIRVRPSETEPRAWEWKMMRPYGGGRSRFQ